MTPAVSAALVFTGVCSLFMIVGLAVGYVIGRRK